MASQTALTVNRLTVVNHLNKKAVNVNDLAEVCLAVHAVLCP